MELVLMIVGPFMSQGKLNKKEEIRKNCGFGKESRKISRAYL